MISVLEKEERCPRKEKRNPLHVATAKAKIPFTAMASAILGYTEDVLASRDQPLKQLAKQAQTTIFTVPTVAWTVNKRRYYP